MTSRGEPSSPYAELDRPPLSEATLRRAVVRQGSLWTELSVVAEAGSTNAWLARRARAENVSGAVLIAEHQTAGRGRLERTWTTPPRAALTMSMLLRPDVPAARWPWIPLITGLAVAAAIQQVTGVSAMLKWPNDVVVGQRKLGGILVERVEGLKEGLDVGLDGGAAAVIGVGVNVSSTADELPAPQATSLVIEGASKPDRSVVARAALRGLEGLVTQWVRRAGDPSESLVSAYMAACSTVGQVVRVEYPGDRQLVGEAVGVDVDGRLLVRTDTGTEAVAAGDVVHLRPA